MHMTVTKGLRTKVFMPAVLLQIHRLCHLYY